MPKVRLLPSTGITRLLQCRVGGGAPQRWPPSAAQTGRTVFPYPAFAKIRLTSRLDGRNQKDKSYKVHLIVKPPLRELFPAATTPALEPMRPQASQDPAIDTSEELTNVGFVVVKPPAANDRVDLVDQLPCSHRSLATGPSPNLIFKVLDRLLAGIGVQISVTDILRLGLSLCPDSSRSISRPICVRFASDFSTLVQIPDPHTRHLSIGS